MKMTSYRSYEECQETRTRNPISDEPHGGSSGGKRVLFDSFTLTTPWRIRILSQIPP